MRDIVYRRYFYQGQYSKKKSKSSEIKDKYLLMLGESSEFLEESWNSFREIKFFMHLKTEKLKDNSTTDFRNTKEMDERIIPTIWETESTNEMKWLQISKTFGIIFTEVIVIYSSFSNNFTVAKKSFRGYTDRWW